MGFLTVLLWTNENGACSFLSCFRFKFTICFCFNISNSWRSFYIVVDWSIIIYSRSSAHGCIELLLDRKLVPPKVPSFQVHLHPIKLNPDKCLCHCRKTTRFQVSFGVFKLNQILLEGNENNFSKLSLFGVFALIYRKYVLNAIKDKC